MTRCICPYCDEDGGHRARCRELVTDDRWGPWCNGCNTRRFTRINAGFADIQQRLATARRTTQPEENK